MRHAFMSPDSPHQICHQDMCKHCITTHLKYLLDTARQTVLKGGLMRVVVEPVVMCQPGPHQFPPRKQAMMKRYFEFPANSYKVSRHVAILIRVCSILYGNLKSDKVCTVRDVYYQDVRLFSSQATVSTTIEKLCKLLQVSRRELNVVPAPNGLIVGDFGVVFDDGSVYEISRANGPTLIPVGSSIFHILLRKIPEFILVVEKEAVFTHLHTSLPEAIVVTGRGFPDHYTRKFLKALSDTCPQVPLLGLVDSDVHGILILQTYRCGSESTLEYPTPLENLQFLGVSILDYPDGLINSTQRDKKLAMSTLKKPWIQLWEVRAWKAELQRGLFMGKKAEMNILDNDHLGRLASYVRSRYAEFKQESSASVKVPRLVDHDISRLELWPLEKATQPEECCRLCHKPLSGCPIQCDLCKAYIHLTCVGLSRTKARKLRTYMCPLCVNIVYV